MSHSFDPSAPLADDLPEHSGRITNGDSGCHPGDSISFPFTSTTTCSNSSVSPPPQSNSPTRGTDSPVEDALLNTLSAGTSMCHQASIPSHAQRSYPFLFTPQQQPYYLAESDKLRKLRQKKERKENRKEKNVISTFKVEGNQLENDYNVEKILESLGERNIEKKVKNGNHVASETKQSKNRKRSNGKDNENKAKLLNDESKSNSSDEEKKPAVVCDGMVVESDENAKVEHSFSVPVGSLLRDGDFSGNSAVSNAEPGDLRRQTSKSTENLSFTKVTTKKKWKKKTSSIDDSNHIYQRPSQHGFPSYETRSFTSGYNLRSRCSDVAFQSGPAIVQGQESSRSSSTSLSEKSTFPLGLSPEQLRVTVASVAFEPQQNSSLNLSADFPPLGPENGDMPEASSASIMSSSVTTNSSNFTAPVWPVIKSSDPIAVIDNETNANIAKRSSSMLTDEATTSVNDNEGKHGGPPDITLPGISNNAQSSLPDVAAQAPMDSAESSGCSGENTPPFTSSTSTYDHQHQVSASSSTCPGRDDSSICGRDLSSRNSTASFFVDTENNVEIVLTDEEYNRRREFGAAPVVIFGKGDHPFEDWTTSPELEFGFELNENLLMTSLDTASTTLVDDAIVSIGESLVDLLPTCQTVTNLQEQGSDNQALLFQDRSSQMSNDESGRETPKAESFVFEGHVGDTAAANMDFGYNHANYVQIINMVAKRWQLVEKELAANAQYVVHYV